MFTVVNHAVQDNLRGSSKAIQEDNSKDLQKDFRKDSSIKRIYPNISRYLECRLLEDH